MSPDIEWQIGEASEQETVVKTQPGPPSRWRKFLIGAMLTLGAGLGAAYSAIPAPLAAPRPTVFPTPTEIPLPSLVPIIEIEAHAQASGDRHAWLALQDPAEAAWRQERQTTFEIWGAPPVDTELFSILASGRLGANRAWADVIQYRNGQFFRETRFYRMYRDNWVRTVPETSTTFWGEERTLRTPYFTLTYRARDEEPVRFMVDQLDRQYAEVCADIGCGEDAAIGEPLLNVYVVPGGMARSRGTRFGRTVTVTLPSPGLSGLYYRTLDTGEAGDNPQIDRYFGDHFLFSILYAASGGLDRWVENTDGIAFVWAVGNWERVRRGLLSPDRLIRRPELLIDTPPTEFDEMWSWSSAATQLDRDRRWSQAAALIKFIDEQYGAAAVFKFFRGLQHAQSLTHLIEVAGFPYSEFETQWLEWLKQFS
ncbi:MAG: hypothetical protein HY870_23320 [Chloroflexi bacterium]|nr:hypothetical protein [Chloroflexota bacterium]